MPPTNRTRSYQRRRRNPRRPALPHLPHEVDDTAVNRRPTSLAPRVRECEPCSAQRSRSSSGPADPATHTPLEACLRAASPSCPPVRRSPAGRRPIPARNKSPVERPMPLRKMRFNKLFHCPRIDSGNPGLLSLRLEQLHGGETPRCPAQNRSLSDRLLLIIFVRKMVSAQCRCELPAQNRTDHTI